MSFEANKIAGAILAAMILAMVSGIIANILVRPTPLAKQAYEVAGAPAEESGAAAPATPAGPGPIAPLMASASVDAGKSKSQLCAACHSFDKGGANRIGPNLYGVVNSAIAEDRGGFAFSSALQEKGKGQKWTLDNLNAWLFKPQDFAKGTKMTFIGLPKAEDRANVIAYLNSMSDSPVPVAQLTAGAATAASGAGQQDGQGGNAPAAGAQGSTAKPAGQAATPGPGNQSNAPTANNPSQTNNAAPRMPGNGQGANSSSSGTEGQQK